MKEYVVREADRLKNFTDNHCAQASFCFRALLKAREIRVNGEKVSSDVPLRAGDEVRYYFTPAQENRSAFSVLYEDENLLVADKESGVNSEAVFCETGLFPVHRLDRNTAGVLLLAKTPEVQAELLALFRERRVDKVYLALVIGTMPRRRAVLEAYLKKDGASSLVTVGEGPAGEKIVTEYETLEERGEETLLKVTLHTGKTHQIRAHLAYLGHPVVGDEKYGDSSYNRKVHATRQRLLAQSVTLHCGGSLSYLDGICFSSQKNLSFSPQNA